MADGTNDDSGGGTGPHGWQAPPPSGPQPPPGPPGRPGYQPPPPNWGPPPSYGPPPGYRAMAGPPPASGLVGAILATLFCCLPFGIVAIVFAAQVSSKWHAGDFEGAYESARNARTWTWVSVVAGIIAVVVWFLVAVSLGSSRSTY